ncbi:RDD family protein [Microbacterium sp. Marseille-Q6965]|uniref:RDD family protein n=1 Tax=Microbacterium sp. Marseille-Q6965 TaxID=2965072 RepID=UPI0021B6EA00|nr:RDD family protein [Microbacterium sp. Marseille-Q6965]
MSTPQYPGQAPDPYGQSAYPGQQWFPGAEGYGQPVSDPYAAPAYPSAPADPFAASPGYPGPAEHAASAPPYPSPPAEHAYGYGAAPEQQPYGSPEAVAAYPTADPYARPAHGVGVPAEPGRRVLAFVVDTLIAVGIAVVFAVLAVVLTFTVDLSVGMIVLLAMYAVLIAWFLVHTGMQGGSGSIGARAQKIRIVRADSGAPLGFGRALLRNVVLGVTGSVFLLGYFSILFDKSGRRQGWHDKAAGAIVVDARPAEPDPYASPSDAYGSYQGDPYAVPPAPAADPYAAQPAAYAEPPAHDPYAAPADPYAAPAQPYAAPADPYAAPADPYAAPPPPYAAPVDPVATAAVTMDPAAADADPYAPPAYSPQASVPPRPADPVADASATAIPEPSAFSASNPPFPAAAPAAQPGESLISSVPGMPMPAPQPREPEPRRREPAAAPVAEPDDFVDDTVIVQRPRPGATKRAVLVWDDDIRHSVTSRTVFGRNPPEVEGSEVVAVRDTTLSLSKTHFAIDVDPTGAWLTDLHSTNGVVIVRHGDRVEVTPGLRTPLEPGDALEMGDRVVTFEALA